MSPLVVCLCVGLIASSARAQEYAAPAWQNYPQSQPAYNPGGAGVAQQGPGCGLALNDVVSNIASYKSNILATGLSAAVAALLAKLPALIFLKVLLFKLVVVPAMFVLVAVPVLMPLLMMLTPMMMSMMNMMNSGSSDSSTTTTAAPTGRSGAEADGRVADADEVLRAVLSSHRCLERVACKLGVRDARSEYKKPISCVDTYSEHLAWLSSKLTRSKEEGSRDIKKERYVMFGGDSITNGVFALRMANIIA